MNQAAATDTNQADTALYRAFEILPYKGHFIVSLKSTAAQRWAARQVKDGNYYTLGYQMMRASQKDRSTPKPEGAAIIEGLPRQTIYFVSETAAEKCAVEFMKNLQIVRGVKI